MSESNVLAKSKTFTNQHWLRRALIVMVIVMHGNLDLHAQATAGQEKASVAVVGTVVDSEGSPIEGAIVSIKMTVPRSEKPIQLSTKCLT